MGAVQNVLDRMRRAFIADKERGGQLLAKGSTSPTYPDSGYDLLQAYGYDALSDYLRLEHDLLSRFVDYEEMDDYPEIASSIDVYADDASQPDTQLQRTVWVSSPDKTLQGVLDDLFYKRLRLDEEIWEIVRSLVKYGNDYEEMLVTGEGVVGLNFLPAPTVRRVEGPRGELYGFVQDFKGRFGYCLAKGSRVWGLDGLTQIEQFEAGRAVAGCRGMEQEPFVVRQRHASGVKKVFRLKTRHREVYLTEDHPVLVQHSESLRKWVKVKDLQIVRYGGKKRNIDYSRTSKIVISTRMPKGEVPEWSSVWSEDPFNVAWGGKGSPTELYLPPRPSEDFCRLFGFMLGDGWTEDRKAYFARGEYPEQNDYYDDLLRNLGLSPIVREIPTGGEQTVVSSVRFCRLFDSLGWVNGFDNKRVPSWVYSLPEGHREALLRGFLDADGWSSKQPGRRLRYFFEIANYDLARDLKGLIDGLGYKCGNISSRQREPGTVINGKAIQSQQPCYTVSFTDEKFEEQFVAETVLHISYFGDAEVYDLEVDDEEHNFVSDGVVVHNSPQEFQKILAQRTEAIRQAMQPGAARTPGHSLQRVSALEPWEVVHFRLRGKHRRSVYGYCERATSKVSTPFGAKEIQHLKPGDVVHVMDNARMVGAEVLNVVCSGEKKVYSIKTRHRENFATAEHPVMVFSETELLTYKSVSDLRRGDQLVLPRPPEVDGVLTRTKNPAVFDRVRLTPDGVDAVKRLRDGERYFYRRTGLKEIDAEADIFCSGSRSVGREVFAQMCEAVPILLEPGAFVTHGRCRGNFVQCPEYVDEDFAWLFGLLLGDGWISQGHDVGVAVSLDETLTENIRRRFRDYGLESKGRYQRVIDEETGEETRVLRQLVVHSADFVDILQGLGFVNGSREKRVPQWVFGSSRGIQEAFVAGFVAADGWEVEQHGQRAKRVELSNYDLVRDLKTLIDGLGWTCGNVCVREARQGKASTHPAMKGKVVNSGPGYILHFHTTPLFDGPFKLERVISVIEQDTPPEPVYDIEVDHDAHNFVADGLVVHNSVLEPARWIWKRLMLLEDAAMIYRLQRAPERFAFYVDVGDLPPAEALAFVNKIRQQHKKKRFVNPSTGKLDLKFEPLSQDDDFWVPVRKGVEGTRIEVLGGPSWQHMDDVEYFQTKMFSALKVPKAYLAQDESTARAVLSSEDVRFARSVLRVQREVRNGLRKVARTHMAALGIDPYATEYNIHMTVPSAIFELAQLEVRNARADLASRMKEHVSLRWVLENVYQLSDEDIKIIIQERSEDVIRDGKAQAEVEKMSAMAQAAAEQAAGGGGGMEGAAAPPNRLKLIERKLDMLPSKLRGGISENELLHGNRAAERRADGKLDKLLRSNDLQARRLREVGALLREVAAAGRGA